MSAFVPQSDEQEITATAPIGSAANTFPEIAGATGETIGTLDEVGVAVESRLGRLKRIGKPLASFFGVQVIVQILTMLAGLLLVRHMSKTEYAFYTIANTMQGVISVLCDSGIGSALSAIGGVVWQDRQRFGSLIQTALEFRRKFGAVVFLIMGPIMWWMLYSNGAGVAYSSLISLIVLAGASLSLVHGVLVVVPRLHARINQLQNAELVLAFLRAILVAAACFILVDAAVAAIIFLVTLAIQNTLYRRWAAKDADLDAPANAQDRAEIWKMVRYQMPNSLFYCFQGQFVIFLISFFGRANDVANVGALGRLTLFFAILTSLVTNVVLPRFARCHSEQRLKSMYQQIVACYVALGGSFLLLVVLLPGPFLWLLGPQYASLSGDLAYLTLSAVVSAISGICYSLNASKGWLKGAWVCIPIIMACQIAMIPLIDLSSIKEVSLLVSIPFAIGSIPFVFQALHAIRSYDQ